MKKFKLLHTADWHIGLTLEHQTFKEEHEYFVDQLVNIVCKEQPDALLVAGDVFDSSTPANDVHNWLIDQLKRLHQACPAMQIVLIAGNHDSANRLMIGHQLTSLINTHLVGKLELNADKTANYQQQVITLANADGEPLALLAAVPFVNRMSYPLVAGADCSYEQRKKAYFAGLNEYMASRSTENLPLLLVAHLTVATEGDVEAPEEVGNIESVESNALGTAYDYVALGHLHHPHHVDGHGGKLNYAGSPIAVSFDEDFPHSVTVVEFEGRNMLRQERLPVQLLHRLVTIPQQHGGVQSYLQFDEALEAVGKLEGKDDYIKLNLLTSGLPDDYKKQAISAVENTGNTLLKIGYKHAEAQRHDQREQFDISDFQQISPFELAIRYLADSGNQISEEARRHLKECVELTMENNRNQ